jgi:hypothetical protein
MIAAGPRIQRRSTTTAVPVGQDLGDAGHDLVRVVAHRDHGIRTTFVGVQHHSGERILTGALAQTGEQRDIAADQGLQRRAEVPKTLRERTTMPLTSPRVRTIR